jgi:hypothetical protein
MRLQHLVLAALGLLAWCSPSWADYTFQFADSSGTAQNAFNVGVGQTIDIRVYILETGGGTNLQSLGLSSAGVKLNTNTSSVANVTGVTPNSAFDSGASTGTGANAFVSEFSSSSVNAPGSGADANRVLVGTFTFTGVSVGQTLTVTALPGLDPDNVLGDGTTSIDDALSGNATSAVITVAAVPEPGTLLLVGLAAAGIAGAGLRRSRRLAIS